MTLTGLRVGTASVGIGAVVVAAFAWKIGLHAILPAFLYFGVVAVLVGVIDLRWRLVPNRIVLPSYVVFAALLALGAGVEGAWSSFGDGASAMVAFLFVFTCIAMLERDGLGAGDIKLAGLVGLAAGFFGAASAVLAFVLAFAIAAVVLLVSRLSGWRLARLPFAPMLAAGAILAILLR